MLIPLGTMAAIVPMTCCFDRSRAVSSGGHSERAIHIPLPTSADEVDEALERGLFLCRREAPVRDIGYCAIRIPIGIAEQVFAPAVADERISLEIEEDVPVVRFGKAAKPEAGLDRKELMQEPFGGAAGNLNASLLPDAVV